jgi:hypothetical protein
MSPTRQPLGKGVGALPGGVVHQIPAVITKEGTEGEVSPGDALGAVLFGLSFGNLRVELDLSSVNIGSEKKKRSL